MAHHKRPKRARAGRKAGDERNAGADSPQMMRALRDGAAELASQAKRGVREAQLQMSRKAREAGEALMSEAVRVAEERKAQVADRMDLVATAAHQTAGLMRTAKLMRTSDYLDRAAATLDGLTDYLEEGDVKRLLKDAADLTRRHPAMVAASMMLIGVTLGRFLAAGRSSTREQTELPNRSPAQLSSKRNRGSRTNHAGRKSASDGARFEHANGNGSANHTLSKREPGSKGRLQHLAE